MTLACTKRACCTNIGWYYTHLLLHRHLHGPRNRWTSLRIEIRRSHDCPSDIYAYAQCHAPNGQCYASGLYNTALTLNYRFAKHSHRSLFFGQWRVASSQTAPASLVWHAAIGIGSHYVDR